MFDTIKSLLLNPGFQRGLVLILGAVGLNVDAAAISTILTAVFTLSGLIHLKAAVTQK